MDILKASCFVISALALLFTGVAYGGWTPEVPISPPDFYWYPHIASQGDIIHVVYPAYTQGAESICYLRSSDAGLTWSEQIILSDPAHSSNAYWPKISIAGANVVVFWEDTERNTYRENVGYAISTDAGITWQDPRYAFSNSRGHISRITYACSGSDMHIIFADQDENSRYVFYHIRSADFGESWSDISELFNAHWASRMDLHVVDDYVHFFWSGEFEDDSDFEIYYFRSADGGISWEEPRAVSLVDGNWSRWPAAAANPLGYVAVIWRDYKEIDSVNYTGIYANTSFNNGADWQEERPVIFPGGGDYFDLVWKGDTLHTLWEGRGDGYGEGNRIYYSYSKDSGGTWANEAIIDSFPYYDSELPSIAASENGLYAIWVDDRYEEWQDGIYFSYYQEEMTDIPQRPIIPDDVAVINAYPNPFNSETIISYQNLSENEIEIYDITGRLVKSIMVDDIRGGTLTWRPAESESHPVSSGIYFIKGFGIDGILKEKLTYLK